jgi:hypothetical protein
MGPKSLLNPDPEPAALLFLSEDSFNTSLPFKVMFDCISAFQML